VGAKGARDAIDAAAEAFKTWKKTSVFERARW
jgi:succinate-semialdehyde dehydrogenase/glutarate-semialdehyde dehydrogenase